MKYRATQDFTRIEAIGPRTSVLSDPCDPIWLHVRVTPSEDVSIEIESALMQGVEPHGVVVTDETKFPYRLYTGTWGFDLNPLLYEIGKPYTIHWRHATQPGVMAVSRSNFVWQPQPQLPRDIDGCILNGILSRNGGIPVSGARIVVEQYKDFVALTHRLSVVDVLTDAFGCWWLEVPRKSIQRIIFGEQIRTVWIPDLQAVALKDAKDYQPETDGRKDAFGYPLPGTPVLPWEPTVTPVPEPKADDFEFVQTIALKVWTIIHNLEVTKPSVSIVDIDGDVVTGDITYVSDTTVRVDFLIPVAGTAHLT